ETCVTVTWMKFALQLLELSGESVYADKIEQSFYNAYRGSLNTQQIPCKNEGFEVTPQPVPFDSYSPLTADTRGRRVGGFNLLPDNTFYGCCACIGAAGVGVIPRMAVMCHDEGVAIQYYEQGAIRTTTPSKAPLQITIDTAYPNDGKVNITLVLNQNERFKLLIRVPSWCDKATITYKNKTETFSAGYAVLDECWQSHDQISADFAMCVKQILPPYNAVNREQFAAYAYGPLVLAADKRIADPDGIYDVACDANGYVQANRVDCPEIPEAHICFKLPLVSGGTVRLIDYASAGKTWSDQSRCAAWIRNS
ncbi:MAG: glycoside hydrolase family 127 protein, partial [Clostridia bacterium]|nr:glycoside hydrolase family 127 protein [Clostridia bacterium]